MKKYTEKDLTAAVQAIHDAVNYAELIADIVIHHVQYQSEQGMCTATIATYRLNGKKMFSKISSFL